MAKEKDLQKTFLSSLIKHHVPVSVYMVNGKRLSGKIESFDEDSVILFDDFESASIKIFKHAVASIMPCFDVDF